MSKIICDICGTSYPDTADCCPICGCSRENAGSLAEDDLLERDPDGEAEGREYPQKRREIFDFDEVNADSDEETVTYAETDYDEEEEEEEEEPRQNTLAVILLTVLIALLLMAAGFIFVRYFLPNMGGKDAVPAQTTVSTEAVPETTELSIPCQELYIISGKTVELNEAGQMFLLHVKANPENTTDKILFTSGDEAVATVTEDGRITAVSEGETVITIRCGVSVMECPVTVKYAAETTVPTTEVIETIAVGETGPEETAADANAEAAGAAEATEAAAVTEASAPAQTGLKNVTLKLKKTDIRLGVYYEFELLLDCDLEQNEVQWSSEHPYIASVDENGVVKAIKAGTTAITATYGDQKVQCIVRCS